MKIIEFHNGGNWMDKVLNSWPMCLHMESIKPVVSVVVGVRQTDLHEPAGWVKWGAWVAFGKNKTKSLYYNGIFFFRFMFPFWVAIGIRWAGKDPDAREYLQLGIGWKLNGRFAVHARAQSDRRSEKGSTGPNWGQAWGWTDGTK